MIVSTIIAVLGGYDVYNQLLIYIKLVVGNIPPHLPKEEHHSHHFIIDIRGQRFLSLILFLYSGNTHLRLNMKLPSFQQIIKGAVKTYLRFPLVLLDAIIGTTVALILIDYEGPHGPTILFRILLSSLLGIPLLIAIVLTAENRKLSISQSLLAQAVGIIILIGYAFTIPLQITDEPAIYIIRFFMLFVGLLLLAAVAPFIGKKGANGFWQHNQKMFIGMLSSLFYTGVLWIGLSMALLAIHELFGANIAVKRYPELFVFLIGVVNTWYFLSSLEEYPGTLETDLHYLKEIKFFGQFVLFPLTVVYFLILYTYLGKIGIEREWPQGWVSKLIFGFSATGIFSLLLLYPIKDEPQYRWIKSAWSWFYAIVIPAAVVLFFALGRRISDYGLTEGRVLAYVMGTWLLLVSIYFLFSKSKNIKIFPASLMFIALVMSWGPWSLFSIAERNQVSRLREVLEKDSILVNGKIIKSTHRISYDDRKRVHGIVEYLHEFHGYDGIQAWFTDQLRVGKVSTGSSSVAPEQVERLLGIGAVEKTVYFTISNDSSMNIAGYDNMLTSQQLHFTPRMNMNPKQEIKGKEISYTHNAGLDTRKFYTSFGSSSTDTLRISLHPLVDSLAAEYNGKSTSDIPPRKMMLQGENAKMKIRVFLLTIDAGLRDDEVVTNSYSMQILYSLKR